MNQKKNFSAPQLNEEQSLAELTLTPVTSGSDGGDPQQWCYTWNGNQYCF